MSEIKSALELALERTAGLKIDASEIRGQQAKKEGKALANRFLADIGDAALLQQQLQQLTTQADSSSKLAGVGAATLAQIRLSSSGLDLSGKIGQLFALLPFSPLIRKRVLTAVKQLSEIQQQFSDHKQQIIDHLLGQLEPQLRQKERQIEQQTGQKVKLTPESEPQYAEALQQQLQQLEQQFQPYLLPIRQVIEQAFQTLR